MSMVGTPEKNAKFSGKNFSAMPFSGKHFILRKTDFFREFFRKKIFSESSTCWKERGVAYVFFFFKCNPVGELCRGGLVEKVSIFYFIDIPAFFRSTNAFLTSWYFL